MRVKSLSATALQTFQECPARFKASHVDRIPQESNGAAMVGTSVHGALEYYVRDVYIEKITPKSWDLLEMYYMRSYQETFNNCDQAQATFKDGLELCKVWFDRNDLDTPGIEVISVEIKKNFPVTMKHTDAKTGKVLVEQVPVNYIIDRVDSLRPGVIRVVDYKTIRKPISSDELRNKVQARLYALAIAIEYKNLMEINEIHIVFDLLRHTEVGIVIHREDNVAFWKMLQEEAQRIAETDGTNPQRILNAFCNYCPIAVTCPEVRKSVDLKGLKSVTVEEAAEMYADLEFQGKAIAVVLEQLSQVLVAHATENDILEFSTKGVKVKMDARRTRAIDAQRAAMILGPDIMQRYGTLRMADVDKLMKGQDITNAQKVELKELISFNYGDIKPKVAPFQQTEHDKAMAELAAFLDG